MNPQSTELSTLETLVNEQQRQLNNSIRNTIIVYAVLIVVVIAYTTFVYNYLTDVTSPQAATEFATSWMRTKLPAQRQQMVELINKNSDKWAVAATTSITNNMPALENQIQILMDTCTDMLVEQLKQQLMPAFTKYLADEAPQLREHYKTLNDDDLMKGLALTMVELIDKEMGSYFNDRFVTGIEKLQRDLHNLAAPKKGLTKKQMAERQVIQSWAFLAEHGEFGEAIFADLIRNLKQRYIHTAPQKEEKLPGVEPGFSY